MVLMVVVSQTQGPLWAESSDCVCPLGTNPIRRGSFQLEVLEHHSHQQGVTDTLTPVNPHVQKPASICFLVGKSAHLLSIAPAFLGQGLD